MNSTSRSVLERVSDKAYEAARIYANYRFEHNSALLLNMHDGLETRLHIRQDYSGQSPAFID